MTNSNNDNRKYTILWDQISLFPTVQLKIGIKRKIFPLTKQYTKDRKSLYYVNNYLELKGKWDNSPGFGSLLSLKLKNISDSSIRIARLTFPAENGLGNFLKDFKASDISFLRNGYQSWSTARSYRLHEKPLRPWLEIVSLASSNMANLPSNTPGILSSEMFSIISNLRTGNSFLVGQAAPFNQFFYIRLKMSINPQGVKKSYFELVYDFGRKMIMPGETIKLDGIIMAQDKISTLDSQYFEFIKKQMNIKIPQKNVKGWSTWYYYFNKISSEDIFKNISILKEKKIELDYIQIDDGYQKYVGDWLNLNPSFENKMKMIADKINEAGYKAGLWLAPFIADKKSELIKMHPEYILRNEYGTPLIAGYNPVWAGKYYYGLDVTNPRFEEYIRKVIRTIVKKWGFKYLKLDFLFAGCLRGGTHHNLQMSRPEILKHGMKIIREEAGKDVVFAGCGMPLSTGIGTVNIMRIGPDTAPYWKKMVGTFLQTGAMIGARNSIRNFMVRSSMHKCLWLNDPDCIMIRKKKTKLTPHQRLTQINAIILSGGILLYSDDFSELSEDIFEEMDTINLLSKECFTGRSIPLDLMANEIPELYYNTAGYIGIFNFKKIPATKRIDITRHQALPDKIEAVQDVWTNEKIELLDKKIIKLKTMEPFSSRLFKIL